MVCVGSDLYLAVQDLAEDFNEAPSATIVKSSDKGRTWTWDEEKPMFADHALTTIFFLDRGRARVGDRSYVYAYALDRNWRDSFTDIVEDPTELFLARVPHDALQDRRRWEWFSGLEEGEPRWSTETEARLPVLTDPRRLYREPFSGETEYPNQDARDLSVISQGSVVYDAPLGRYLYTSWTEFTYEFYEAEEPWGPFRLFFRADFGRYPWSTEEAGGYATTLPSKFIADDGLDLYLQSNTFVGGVEHYGFSLRRFRLDRCAAEAEDRAGDP